ncbi:uncharacterized protein [Triticum aestivum]|uniref:uncharacterized protein n=1 Tax=Triticum aestivum TaxID=4565 RepID=UPI001D01E85B|nr:uncharacterized protein LOC123078842 [Triticum aestivum]
MAMDTARPRPCTAAAAAIAPPRDSWPPRPVPRPWPQLRPLRSVGRVGGTAVPPQPPSSLVLTCRVPHPPDPISFSQCSLVARGRAVRGRRQNYDEDGVCLLQSKFDKSFLLYIQSWPEIAKFQNEPFPLYNKLGDLYDGHIAEGNFNFTSIEVTQVSDGDPEVEREQPAFSFNLNQYDDDVHMYNNPRDAAQSDETRYATQSDGRRDAIQSDEPRDATQTGAPGGSNKKPVKESKKKTRDDPMVEVMAQYVEIKRKQAEEESVLLVGSKNAQEFSLNSAAEDEDSVVAFLRSKMAELHQHI